MNPITSSVAGSCALSNRLSPRASPRSSPRSSPRHSPISGHRFSHNLSAPAGLYPEQHFYCAYSSSTSEYRRAKIVSGSPKHKEKLAQATSDNKEQICQGSNEKSKYTKDKKVKKQNRSVSTSSCSSKGKKSCYIL